jgi:hypothetical protein
MLVRDDKPRFRLPRLEGLDHAAQLNLEGDNVRKCLAYARE